MVTMKVTIKQLKRLIREATQDMGYSETMEINGVPLDTQISLNQLKLVNPECASAFLAGEEEMIADDSECKPINPDDPERFEIATAASPMYEMYQEFAIDGLVYLFFDDNGYTNVTLVWDGEVWGG